MEIRKEELWFIWHHLDEEDEDPNRIEATIEGIQKLYEKYPDLEEYWTELAIAIHKKKWCWARRVLLDLIFKELEMR